MRRRRYQENEQDLDQNDWLTTYADAITLLMAFFIMLVSFSKIDIPLFEQVQAGIKEHIGKADEVDTPIFRLHSIMEATIIDSSDLPPEAVDISYDDDGIVIDFASGSFFRPGTIQLTESAQLILAKINRELGLAPFDIFMVDVEGHTDSDPIHSVQFPSNWELSAGRAAAVVRHFISLEMEPERLKASGYADTKPKVPEVDVMGNILHENKAANRRISIRLYPAFVHAAF